MLLSDVFVSMDTAQYVKREWQNRQKFHYAGRDKWLSVSVNNGPEPIMAKKITNTRALWDHWRYIKDVYQKTPFFKAYAEPLQEIYSQEWLYLNDLCDALTLYAKSILNIDTPYVRDSQNGWMNNGYKKGDFLVDCIKRAVATDEYDEVIYLPGGGPIREDSYLNKKFDGSNMTEGEKIVDAGIALSPYPFHHPVYRQYQFEPNEPFMPRLSIFDLIFNCGEASREVLESAGKQPKAVV